MGQVRPKRENIRALSAVSGAICALLGAIVVSWGCGGAQFNGVEYRDKDVAFRLGQMPAGMRQIASDDARIALQNDRAGVTVAIGARCHRDSDDVPLRSLVQHLFLQFEARQIMSEREFVLDGRNALRTELEARLDGVRRHFVVVVMKKDECVYDFLHVDGGGHAPLLERSRADFDAMIEGFRVLDP